MKKNRLLGIHGYLIILLGFIVSACSHTGAFSDPETAAGISVQSMHDIEAAQQALISFFTYLHDGGYENAAALYGGTYSGLQDLNPGIAPDDHAALFKNACTVNGAN